MNEFLTPFYLYKEADLDKFSDDCLNMPNAFGLTLRYAMKANPNRSILKFFYNKGLKIDASSEFEVYRAIAAGIKAEDIQLTAQELSKNLKGLLETGVVFNATSLHQLEEFAKIKPGAEVSIRVNPGVGSGWTNRTNVWGPSSSFGIWYEQIDDAKAIAEKYDLKISKIHTHIGSGSDPLVWAKVSSMSLDIVSKFPDAHTLNLGWGFKVWRIEGEKTTSMKEVGESLKELFEDFAEKDWRKLHLEIEPGTYLVANTWYLVSSVQDIMNTWEGGYNFVKLDAWMTELVRPSMYWAQHPIEVITDNTETGEVLFVGHCCESWDIFTPAAGDPEGLNPRVSKIPNIWDKIIIGWAWAYSASMACKNYNSFPECEEVMEKLDWSFVTVRKRQSLEDIWKNEV